MKKSQHLLFFECRGCKDIKYDLFTKMTKTKTKTKNEKYPTLATFSESRGCKDIKNDIFTKNVECQFVKCQMSDAEYYHYIFTIYSQYFHDIFTIFSLYFHNIFTIFSQYHCHHCHCCHHLWQ